MLVTGDTSSEPPDCQAPVHPAEHLGQGRAQALALGLQLAGHGLHLVGQLAAVGLQPGDLLAEPSARSRPGPSRAWASASAITRAASASASALVSSTNFWARSRVRCRVSSATAGSAGAGAGRRGLGLGRQLGLELGDGLGRLAQALGVLAQLLLQAFGLDGGLLQVLVDVVAVVALQGLPELHGAERVECRLGSVHAAMVAARREYPGIPPVAASPLIRSAAPAAGPCPIGSAAGDQ